MGKENAAATTNYQVRALERALAILDLFGFTTPQLTLTEIASRVSLPKSTTTRLLSVLERRGWLERSPETERYRIGVHAFEVGNVYIQTTTLETEARPFMEQLVRDCHQTANLGVLSQGDVVHLAVVAPDRPIRFSTLVGQREHAHATGLGKVLLAALDDAQLRAIVVGNGLAAHTARTITTLDALREHLAQVRGQGYALDDEETSEGLRCVAAPVYDARGQVAAALSISGHASEFSMMTLPTYIAAIRDAASGLSTRLGYAWDDDGYHQRCRAD